MIKLPKKSGTDFVDLIRIGGIVLSVMVLITGALFLLPGSGQFLESIFGREEVAIVDFYELTVPADAPDHYLVCPEDICLSQTPDQIAPVYDISAGRLRAILLGFVDNQPTVSFWRMDPAINQFDFKEIDPTMRMPDVITVQTFELADGKSTIAIYSRSLHGLADAGSNRRRVQRWLAMINP